MGHDLSELDDELLPVVSFAPPMKLTEPPRRRRRKMFALAEPLESRAMLSAVTAAFEGIGIAGFGLAVDNQSAAVAQDDLMEADRSDSKSVDQTFESGAQTENSADAEGFRFGASLAPSLDGLFELGFSAGMNAAASSVASPTSKGASEFEFDGDSEDEGDASELGLAGDVIELRLAGSGQVVAYGSSHSLQDDAGLTVGDSDGPTTYVRATDADGRAVMRLVFVQKGLRTTATVKPQRVIADSVVVAEADLDSTPSLTDSSERATLTEVATALDAPQADESTQVTQKSSESTLMANTNPTTMRVASKPSTTTRTRSAGHDSPAANSRVIHDVACTRGAATHLSGNEDQDVADFETSELAAAVLHPQPKYIALAMLIVGTLARPFSRVRRLRKPVPATE